MVLNNLNEMKCLRSLVLASPSFHQIYLANRERVLTRTTFRELQSRSINMPSLIAVCEVRLKNDHPPSEELKVVMQSLYDYFHENKPFSPTETSTNTGLKLSVTQCLALLTIEELSVWELKTDTPWGQRYGMGDPVAVRSSGVAPMERGFKLSCARAWIYEICTVIYGNGEVTSRGPVVRSAQRLSVIVDR